MTTVGHRPSRPHSQQRGKPALSSIRARVVTKGTIAALLFQAPEAPQPVIVAAGIVGVAEVVQTDRIGDIEQVPLPLDRAGLKRLRCVHSRVTEAGQGFAVESIGLVLESQQFGRGAAFGEPAAGLALAHQVGPLRHHQRGRDPDLPVEGVEIDGGDDCLAVRRQAEAPGAQPPEVGRGGLDLGRLAKQGLLSEQGLLDVTRDDGPGLAGQWSR